MAKSLIATEMKWIGMYLHLIWLCCYRCNHSLAAHLHVPLRLHWAAWSIFTTVSAWKFRRKKFEQWKREREMLCMTCNSRALYVFREPSIVTVRLLNLIRIELQMECSAVQTVLYSVNYLHFIWFISNKFIAVECAA